LRAQGGSGRIGFPSVAHDLKLGVNVGYWAGGPPPGAAEMVLEAERLGFDSMWTAEAYGSDALVPLAWWGASTEKLKLGPAIAQLSARQPATTDGPHYPLPVKDGTGLGKPLKSSIHPLRNDIPIYLAAQGPKNIALA